MRMRGLLRAAILLVGNAYFIAGRTNYPLQFDRARRPKAAFDAVLRVLQG